MLTNLPQLVTSKTRIKKKRIRCRKKHLTFVFVIDTNIYHPGPLRR